MTRRHILGVIPARGGSKGIPGKNLHPLLGRPLIEYTFDAAKASRSLGRIILSTDDEEIATFGRAHGVEVPFMRPPHLAQDDTPMIDVLIHVLEALHAEAYEPDCLVLLQPTSPLRRAEHIDAAIDLLLTTGADTVVSVMEVPHQFSPVSVMRLGGDGKLSPFCDGPMILRRQDKPCVYARNGPAVLVVRRKVVESGKLYGEDVRALEMSKADSVDIDDPFDLVVAECLLQRRHALE